MNKRERQLTWKLVGSGFDYNVYELPLRSGHVKIQVIKIIRPFSEQCWIRFKEFEPIELLKIVFKKEARKKHMEETVKQLSPILEKHRNMFANAYFKKTTYYQDKVTSIKTF